MLTGVNTEAMTCRVKPQKSIISIPKVLCVPLFSFFFQISKRDVSVVPFLTGLISYKWIMKVVICSNEAISSKVGSGL